MHKKPKSYPKEGRKRLKGSKKYKALQEEVFERDDRTCINPACSCKYGNTIYAWLEMHHVRKKSQLGSDVKYNCVTICNYCHNDIEYHRIDEQFAVDYLIKLYGDEARKWLGRKAV